MNTRLLLILFALSSALSAAPPPELTVLRQQYDKILAERVTAPFDASLAELNAKFTTALDTAATSAKKAGRLDDVLAIQDDQKRLAEKLPIPDDTETTPALLKPLRAIYREQLQKLTDARTANHQALLPAYTAKLQALEVTLTQADRIDEAKELRTYREGLAQSGPLSPLSGAPSAAGTPPSAPPPVAAASTNAPKVKGDDRKAAEWLLKVGAYFVIEERGKKSTPTSPDDLPKGRFSILSIGLNGRDSKEPITVDAYPSLAGLQQLTSFATDYLPATDSDLSFLATCPALQVVAIFREARITDAIVDHLTGLKSLRDFSVKDVGAFTGATLHKMGGIKSLTRMEFTSTGFNDTGAEAAASCKNINSLTLEGSKQLTDAGLMHLSKLPAVRHLSLCTTGCTAEGVAAAKLKVEHLDFNRLAGKPPSETAPIIGPAYPSVTSIRFAQSEGLTQDDFRALAHFKSLKSFSPLAIKDPLAWAGLAAVPTLTALWIDRNPFTDAEVDHLLGISNLIDLTLGTVDVTDAGLLKIAALKKLKQLHLKPCPKVTEAGIAALKKQRPDIQVSR